MCCILYDYRTFTAFWNVMNFAFIMYNSHMVGWNVWDSHLEFFIPVVHKILFSLLCIHMYSFITREPSHQLRCATFYLSSMWVTSVSQQTIHFVSFACCLLNINIVHVLVYSKSLHRMFLNKNITKLVAATLRQNLVQLYQPTKWHIFHSTGEEWWHSWWFAQLQHLWEEYTQR